MSKRDGETPDEPTEAAAAAPDPADRNLPTEANAVVPEPADWDTPTEATAVVGGSADWDVTTQASPVAPAGDLPSRGELVRHPRTAPSLDVALTGSNDLARVGPIGRVAPQGEGLQPSTLDDVFGDNSFVEYDDQAVVPALIPRARATPARRVAAVETVPVTPLQGRLLWVLAGLLAALTLLAIFLVARSVASDRASIAQPTAAPSAGAPVVPTAPQPVGDHAWSTLFGGECVSPFASAWQASYTVVLCSQPHAAQLVGRGVLPDAASAPYPGLDALIATTGQLCRAPTVVDYSVAGGAKDIEISTSFAADAADWDAGNRTYYCFVSRLGGGELTTSIAAPRPDPTPTPAATG